MVVVALLSASSLGLSVLAFILLGECSGYSAVGAFVAGIIFAAWGIGFLYYLGDIYDLYKFCDVKEKENED